jgi:hypothetical protein
MVFRQKINKPEFIHKKTGEKIKKDDSLDFILHLPYNPPRN